MHWRIPAGAGIISVWWLIFWAISSQPSFDVGGAIFTSTVAACVGGGFLYFLISISQWAQRQDALKKPFGKERVRILERQWRLASLQGKLPDPDKRFQAAILECSEQLRRIDRAVVALHEVEIWAVKEQDELVEQVEETVQRTITDLQQTAPMLPLPTPARIRQ